MNFAYRCNLYHTFELNLSAASSAASLVPRIRLTHGSGDNRYTAAYNGAAKAVHLDVGFTLPFLLVIRMRYFSPFLGRIPNPF